MGSQAKERRAAASQMVYHHTSTLHTNLIWMSGAIEVEGHSEPVLHPHLGTLQGDIRFRRACDDFPTVAWFTTDLNVPKCLIQTSLFFKKPDSADAIEMSIDAPVANAISLRRMALGFRLTDIPVVPWRNYYGYNTPEGRQLNDTARASGDNPDVWYVSELRVSLDQMIEIRVARSIQNLKMERRDDYLEKLRPMLELIKREKVYVPPTWLSREDASLLADRLGLPLARATG